MVVSTSSKPQVGRPPLSAVRGCLFNLFTDTLHIGGRSSIRKLRTRHTVVTGTHIHGMGITYIELKGTRHSLGTNGERKYKILKFSAYYERAKFTGDQSEQLGKLK